MHQTRQLAQIDPLNPHRLGFITFQTLFIEVGGQHHLDLLTHVTRRQRQLGEVFQLAGAITGLLLQFTLGGGQHIFARLNQAFGQRHFVLIGTAAVLFNQNRVFGIDHGHNHDRAIAVATPHQPLVCALDTIGKAQLHFFDAKQSATGNNFTGKYGGFLAHSGSSI